MDGFLCLWVGDGYRNWPYLPISLPGWKILIMNAVRLSLHLFHYIHVYYMRVDEESQDQIGVISTLTD